jgi:hypothetical protein
VETLQPLSGPRAGAALRRAFTELFRVYVDALCRAFEEHQSADGPFNEMLGETPHIFPGSFLLQRKVNGVFGLLSATEKQGGTRRG